MFRVALITNTGKVLSKNFKTKEEVDEYILYAMDKEGVKRYRILDKDKGEIIETDKYRRDKNV